MSVFLIKMSMSVPVRPVLMAPVQIVSMDMYATVCQDILEVSVILVGKARAEKHASIYIAGSAVIYLFFFFFAMGVRWFLCCQSCKNLKTVCKIVYSFCTL